MRVRLLPLELHDTEAQWSSKGLLDPWKVVRFHPVPPCWCVSETSGTRSACKVVQLHSPAPRPLRLVAQDGRLSTGQRGFDSLRGRHMARVLSDGWPVLHTGREGSTPSRVTARCELVWSFSVRLKSGRTRFDSEVAHQGEVSLAAHRFREPIELVQFQPP
jgi:hypothetical protein